MNIIVNNANNANDKRNTTDWPIQPSWSEPELPGQYIHWLNLDINPFHWLRKKNMKIAGTTNTMTKKK